MNSQEKTLLVEPETDSHGRSYHGWVNVVMGALAMTATLPGRTFGLGLIKKPLIEDLKLTSLDFDQLNLWAVLLGACLAWPVGWLIDRWGSRIVGGIVILGLGAAVVVMSKVEVDESLFPSLLVVRALGQGALSIVSLAMVGKWFARRVGPAMGVFAVLLAIGFIAGNEIVGRAVQHAGGWRAAWRHLGFVLLGMGPVIWILVRSTPESVGLRTEQADNDRRETKTTRDATLWEALCSPAFWIYSWACSLWGLVFAAVTMNSQLILDDRGLGETYLHVMAILAGFGVVCNLLGGWLAMHWPMGRLLGISMILLAGALVAFPFIHTDAEVIAYALVLGGSGGFITVVFFAFYRQAFGRGHLGRIQGSAHILSVFASAIGPVLLDWCKEETLSYDAFFLAAAPVMLMVGLAGWWVAVPDASPSLAHR